MTLKKIIIIIPIVIIIISVLLITNYQSVITGQNTLEENSTNQIVLNQTSSINEIKNEIEEKYSIIDSNEEKYVPKNRDWPTSGPFKIDRTEYILGEKIFFIAENLRFNEKGEIIFVRTLNGTHYGIWKTFPFDGLQRDAFNVYFEPRIQKEIGICSKKDLIGEWKVYFKDVDYEPISFSIIDKILPGDEEKFNRIEC